MSTVKVVKSELSSEASNLSSKVSSLSTNNLVSSLNGVSDYDGISVSSAAKTLAGNIKNAIKDLETASTNIKNYSNAINNADIKGKDGKQIDNIEFTYEVKSDGSREGNIKAIWNYFKNKGLSDAAICGILGNISAECGFNPAAIESNGEGHGLIQWSFGRRTSFLNAAKAKGVDWRDLNFQLDYLWNESVDPNSEYGKRLQAAGFYDPNVSISKAAYEFHRIVEGSNDTESMIQNNRVSVAKDLYNKYKDAISRGTNSTITTEGINAISSIEELYSAKAEDTGSKVTNNGSRAVYTNKSGGGSTGGYYSGNGRSGGGSSGGSHSSAAKIIDYDTKTAAEYAAALKALKLKNNFKTEEEARQQVVDIAATQLGNTDETEYAKLLGESNGIQWCSEFAVWCAYKSGLVDAGLFPKFAGAAEGVSWFKQHNQFQGGNYTPKAGDVIFIGNPNLHHTALVEKVENGKIYTIEGNIQDKVVRKERSIGSSDIYGFGLPDYSQLVN